MSRHVAAVAAAAACSLSLTAAGCEAPATPEAPTTTAPAAPAPRSGQVEANGVRLHYLVWGDLRSGRTPLLILHGSHMSADAMIPLAQRFAATRPVIALDAREHGRNGDLPTAITYELLADDTAAALVALGVQRADVLGYSMGAITAVQMAVRHPERINHLVSLSGVYDRQGWLPETLAGMERQTPEMFAGTGLAAEYRRLSPTPDAFPRLVADLRELEVRPYGWSEAQVRALPHRTMIIFGDADGMRFEHALQFFRLRGGGDPQAAAQGFLSEAPRARLAILPGSSHVGLHAQPDLIASLVTPFLDDVTPALPPNFLTPGERPAAAGRSTERLLMRVVGIDHVVIRTVDHAAMLRFYTEALGCAVERARPEIGLWHLRAGDNLIDLVPVGGKLGAIGGAAPGREGRNMDHLCLKVADFDLEQVRAHLEAHGVTVGESGLRYGASGEGTSVYVQDPDGNGVELRG